MVLVQRRAQARIRLKAGTFDVIGYWDQVGDREQVALVCGDVRLDGGRNVLVRVHSECVTGDSFASLRCDCGPQLDESLEMLMREERGAVVYARGHEGRGIGLLNKLKAYGLQDAGADTVDANLQLGLSADARDYTVATAILQDLGVTSVRLISNNPAKRIALEACGVVVESMVNRPAKIGPYNAGYLSTKRQRMGHTYLS